jgi:hypothetical protein
MRSWKTPAGKRNCRMQSYAPAGAQTGAPRPLRSRACSRLYTNRCCTTNPSMRSSTARITCPAKGFAHPHGSFVVEVRKSGKGQGGRNASGSLGLQPLLLPANHARKFPVKREDLAHSPSDCRRWSLEDSPVSNASAADVRYGRHENDYRWARARTARHRGGRCCGGQWRGGSAPLPIGCDGSSL